MTANPLIGTWRLVAYTLDSGDGQVSYPYGAAPVGYLTYTADGFMSVALMSADRPPYTSGDRLSADPAEKARAAETYQSYCGRYTLEPGRVVHHLAVSLVPNWTGGDQVRFLTLDGARLTLRTPPFPIGGRPQTAVVVWERT